jgi:hypothetical protein
MCLMPGRRFLVGLMKHRLFDASVINIGGFLLRREGSKIGLGIRENPNPES